jgi:hypothetical protein
MPPQKAKKAISKFAAFNQGILVHGDRTEKQECALTSSASMSSTKLPLRRNANFVDYLYFLLDLCSGIRFWVQQQDEVNTESNNAPGLNAIFGNCLKSTKSETGGFFNVGNMRLEWIQLAKQQKVTRKCGIFTSLSWLMFVSVQR